jgi:hypothetical protein
VRNREEGSGVSGEQQREESMGHRAGADARWRIGAGDGTEQRGWSKELGDGIVRTES